MAEEKYIDPRTGEEYDSTTREFVAGRKRVSLKEAMESNTPMGKALHESLVAGESRGARGRTVEVED